MSSVAKDFLFKLQLLVARTGSDLSLRKSFIADTHSALEANGLNPPAGARFEVNEDKAPFGVINQGSRFFLNLPTLFDLNQVSFSTNQNTKLVLSASCNSEEVETSVETLVETLENVSLATQMYGPTEVMESIVGEVKGVVTAEVSGFL